VRTASIIRAKSHRLMMVIQYVPLKRPSTSARLYGAEFQKTNVAFGISWGDSQLFCFRDFPQVLCANFGTVS
jgi:hypothetical protein